MGCRPALYLSTTSASAMVSTASVPDHPLVQPVGRADEHARWHQLNVRGWTFIGALGVDALTAWAYRAVLGGQPDVHDLKAHPASPTR